MAHPNEDLLRKGFDAFGKGDMDTLRELFADDVVWHFPGKSQLAGDYRGKEEVLGFLGKSFELSGGTLRLEIHDVLANDEHGTVLTHVTGQREGKSLDDNSVQVFHIRDGKVTESWIHPGDLYAGDDFWS
jgi:ketosteroid isomerase-like protein